MLVILPAISFCLLLRFFRLRQRGCPEGRAGWRRALFMAILVFSLILVAITELLSLCHGITTAGVAAAWGLVILATMLANRRRGHTAPVALRPRQEETNGSPASMASAGTEPATKWSWLETFLLAGTILSLLATLAVALVAPPNNPDGIEYHLPRVLHWVQNQTVAHYPTHILRQIQFAPANAYAILHAHLLWGGPGLANLVQWLCLAGCLVAGSLIAKELGAGRPGQLFAALLVVTMPVAIMQATNVQNDMVLSLWLSGFAYFILAWERNPFWDNALGAGACLGLAIFTKGTAYIFAAPLAVYALIAARTHWRRCWQHLPAASGIALLINAGHYVRNIEVFGEPLGKVSMYGMTNEIYTPAALVSNVVRNLSLHAQINFNPTLHPYFYGAVAKIHEWLGLAIVDQRLTWGIFWPLPFEWTRWDDNQSGNPVHMLLIALGVVIAVTQSKRLRSLRPLGFISAVLAGFFLFCLLLKFQMLHSRLHLPVFVLAMPFVAAQFTATFGGAQKKLAVLAIVLLALATPVYLYNLQRPLAGKLTVFNSKGPERFCYRSPENVSHHYAAAKFLRQNRVTSIGLICAGGEEEYLYWVYLRDLGGQPFRIEHVFVKNASKIKAGESYYRDFRPAAVIEVMRKGIRMFPGTIPKKEQPFPPELQRDFERKWKSGAIRIFLRKPAGSAGQPRKNHGAAERHPQ